MIEHKSLPFEVKAAVGGEPGEFEGYGGAMLNVDSVGDIIAPGAFAADLPEFLSRGFIGGLNHDWNRPVGKPVEAREQSPHLYVRGRISDTDHGRECRTLMADGVVKFLSIGYSVPSGGHEYLEAYDDVKSFWASHAYTPSEQDIERAQGGVRLLTRVKLYEVSPVTVPANDRAAILASKAEAVSAGDFDAHSRLVVSAVGGFAGRTHDRVAARLKEGRVLSAANRSTLASVADALEQHGKALRDLLASTEPVKADPQPAPDTPDPARLEAYRREVLRSLQIRRRLLPALTTTGA